MKRLIKSLIIFSCLYCMSSYNQAKAAENITVKGSDTMVILGQRLAEEYMNKNKDVTIQVTGGGSGTGIAALLNKTTNLANSSRPIKDAEAKKALEAGVETTEVKIALDGVAYFEKIPELKIVKIKKLDNTPAVSPMKEDRSVNYEQIWNGEYPIARYLYVYVAGKMTPAIKKYIDWILGPEGQNIVAKIGYVPLGIDNK